MPQFSKAERFPIHNPSRPETVPTPRIAIGVGLGAGWGVNLFQVGPLPPAGFQSDDRVQGLDPAFKAKLLRVVNDLRAKGWKPRVAEGLRTVAEQRAKIAGRFSPPGTDVPGSPKASKHLAGEAADVIDRRWGWKTPGGKNHQFWTDLGAAAQGQGLVWGGTWKNQNVAHVQMP